jgi:hypothetical protein
MMRFLVALASLATAVPAVAAPPVLVELFTSQGCSSCPPADVVLTRLAREPGIVAISRPVTYWDGLGWKDSFARPENTQRQRAYAARFGSASVYTPQAVVGGSAEGLGANEKLLRRLVAAQRPDAAVNISRGPEGFTVALSGPQGATAEVRLIGLRRHGTADVRRGENGGRRLHYTNVVTAERVLARWSGGAKTFSVARTDPALRGADRLAVVVQPAALGPVRGAATVSF